jgi:hypothetical protein
MGHLLVLLARHRRWVDHRWVLRRIARNWNASEHAGSIPARVSILNEPEGK